MRRHSPTNIWPGFVDAISTLLIIILFLLMVFTLAQHFLTETLSGRDQALSRLTQQVAELSELLAIEKKESAELRSKINQLDIDLENTVSERDALKNQLVVSKQEKQKLAEALMISETKLNQTTLELASSYKEIEVDREKIKLQLGELEQLQRDIEALKKLRTKLENQVSLSATALKLSEKKLSSLRDKSKELEAKLSTETERTLLAQKQLKETKLLLSQMKTRAGALEKGLLEEKNLSATERARVELLNQQIAALRQKLEKISAALEAYEEKSKRQQVKIINLGKRLNAALAAKVEELARYRSEFFGKLSEVIGDRGDIRIVGDRFVFQSEILFGSGSSEIKAVGRRKIAELGKTLSEIGAKIPANLDWVLRVDGHTDRRPIRNREFRSNWELSTARAVSVIKLLIQNGLPPERLVAAGFGEFHPIENSSSKEALQRNRRIEFKLTNR